jgi:hypothetical protein
MTTNLKSNVINTNTLEPITVASLVNAYTTQTGTMQIGSATSTGNIGICAPIPGITAVKTIQVGNRTGDSVHVANVEHTGFGIGNATSSTVGQFDICTAQTTGILNIGTGVRTGVGAINLGTGSTTSAINIGNKTATANTVTINSGSAGITLASTGTANAGINVKGNAVDVVTAGNALSLGTTNATGGISIGNGTQNNITVGNVTIGNGNIQRSAVSDSLTIAPNTTTGNLSLGVAQTTGTLDIGTGVRTTTGTISIGTGSTTSAINIGNKTATANTVTINSGSAGITLASTGTANAGINVKGNAVDIATAGGALSLGTTNATGGITIGNTTQNNITVGNVTIGNGTIQRSAVNDFLTIAPNTTTGNLSLGVAQTSGILDIGTGARIGAGNINIGTASESSAINIGNKTNTANGVVISAGTPGITLSSGNTLAGIKVTNNTIDVVTATETFDIGKSQLTGVLNIGTGDRTTIGEINIGTRNLSSNINIGYSNLNAQNRVFINSGPSGTSFLSNAGSNGINISTTVVDTYIAGTLSLGTATASGISIGPSTGTTTVNNALTSTGLITANAGLTMGTAQNITLKTNTTAPTEQTQLGGKSVGTLLATTPINGSVLGTITITTPGIYILAFGFYLNITALGNVNYVQLTGTNVVTNNFGYTDTITGSQISFNGCEIVNCTASTYTATVALNSTPVPLSLVAGFFTATRIG